MKIKINLVNEAKQILSNNGRYSKNFSVSMDQDVNKQRVPTKIYINPSSEIKLSSIFLNENPIEFDMPKQGMSTMHWNIPIRVVVDKKLINVGGDNNILLFFE